MDHGFKHCIHNRCINHSPEWETINTKEMVPLYIKIGPIKIRRRGIFYAWCCSKPMLAFQKILITLRCKKCGRIGMNANDLPFYVCDCCGYHFQLKND